MFDVVHYCVVPFWSYSSSLRRNVTELLCWTLSSLFFSLFQQTIARIKTLLWFYLHSRVTKLHARDEIVQIRMAETCTYLFCFAFLNHLMIWFCSLKNIFEKYISPFLLIPLELKYPSFTECPLPLLNFRSITPSFPVPWLSCVCVRGSLLMHHT